MTGGSATVTQNTISGGTTGIDVDGGSATVTQNTITGITTGIRVVTGGNLTSASQNFITGNGTGVVVGTGGLVGSIVDNNKDLFGDAVLGVSNTSGTDINASGNWWGSNTPAGVAAEVSANVDYTPGWTPATDTSPTAGFQGGFSVLHVGPGGPQTGGGGRITEAIALLTATGAYIIHNGTYGESVTTSGKAVTLSPEGTAISQPTITGALTLDNDDTLAVNLNETASRPRARTTTSSWSTAPSPWDRRHCP